MTKRGDKYKWQIGAAPPPVDHHSLVKHQIVREYLGRYIKVLMSNYNIEKLVLSIVDGFAGGGEYTSPDGQGYSPGSPQLVVDTVTEQEALLNIGRDKPRKVDAKYYFVEQHRSTCAYLNALLAAKYGSARLGQDIISVQGSFDAHIHNINLDIIRRQGGERAIFLLDQYAYDQVPVTLIQKIFTEVDKPEVILTFGVDSLISFLADNAKSRKVMKKLGQQNYNQYITGSKVANKNLTSAKKAKNDEFYTQFSDIQKEVESYLEYDPNTFKGKVVYSNCDDPFESNFFRYFVLNFSRLGLKRIISTSYKPSPVANSQLGLFGDDKTLPKSKGRPKVTANKFIINEVGDVDGDGSFTLEDIAKQLRANKNNEWTPLEDDGDFRSDECVELLKQSDIVVTNPPFSLFREYITQLFEHKKQFLIIGNLNAITYKEVFPMIKENKVWLGNNARVNGGAMFYEIPEAVANLDQVREIKTDENGKKTYITRVQGVRWFTNLDHGRLHQPIPLMTHADVLKFSTNKPFVHYDNYDAIEIALVKNIPKDYEGVMGVPISFLDKYSPDQFEILGTSDNGLVDDKYKKTLGLKKQFVDDYYKGGGTGAYKEGNPTAGFYENGIAKMAYKRIFIKHKKK